MLTEITRLLSAWARHPDHGVNAQLANVGRLRMNGTSDPAPSAVTVYDDIDSPGGDEDTQALEIDPPKVPAIVVWVRSDIDMNLPDVNYLKTGDPCIVDFAYITRDVPVKKARLDGQYTLRALRRCLWRFNRDAKRLELDRLNGIKILYVKTVSIQDIAAGVGQSMMWGLASASVHIVDENP